MNSVRDKVVVHGNLSMCSFIFARAVKQLGAHLSESLWEMRAFPDRTYLPRNRGEKEIEIRRPVQSVDADVG